MLDLQYICDNLEPVAENCRNRGVEVDLDRIVALRGRRSELITSGDELRREQKATSSQIPTAESDEAKQALIARGRELREQLQGLDGELAEVEADLRSGQSRIPNMTHPDAPIALGDDGHVELRRWGDVPEFDFEPRDHVAISEAHNLIDFEAGSRVAGHGFYFLKNEAVLLELALMQLAVTRLREAGFTLMTTPDLAKDEIIEGIGFLPRGPESQIYSIENSELSLVATAEITLGGAFKDQVLEIDDLPLRCAGISHCFRTEAGAHGRATRGIYRVHQFTKVEMFGFTAPTLEASNAFHNEVVEIEEGLFQALEIPYRVVDTCTGDLGGPAYRKFDLEAWMPGRGDGGDWGEVTSASNCTDYQSRRLGIRCRTPGKKGTEFVHTLNGTAVATSRALIALLENHQQADGTIHIPEALRPWVGSDQIG
ncbi:MAG TPA: serine--tRNA ligase [Planctomycetaceae bacterium]|nr:serine--tRNA ligase [Planctomycetales bacterium]HAA62266.1 serine--tRNA ligase [Planctomycetaceae bacterium]|tara:strand:+ start:1464 stop:2744 length:1281 start_codon:yes stop_codon:yes gene_type:complete